MAEDLDQIMSFDNYYSVLQKIQLLSLLFGVHIYFSSQALFFFEILFQPFFSPFRSHIQLIPVLAEVIAFSSRFLHIFNNKWTNFYENLSIGSI